MPATSERTSQVKVVANWTAGPNGTDCRFVIMIVTAGGQQHRVAPARLR